MRLPAMRITSNYCPRESSSSQWVCGQHFTIEHALSCSRGGFPSIWHNEICNIMVNLLSEVCHGVGIEPSLQPVTGSSLSTGLSIKRMVPDLTLWHKAFDGVHSLMSGFSTPTHLGIKAPPYLSVTGEMSWRRVHMRNVCRK